MELVSIEITSHVGEYHNVQYTKVVAHYKCPLCGDFITPKHWAACRGERFCAKHKNLITVKHGFARGSGKHPLYRVWLGMKRRCLDKTDERYKDYGGRGITICDEWIKDPAAFVDWGLKNGWKPGLEIDRQDNNGSYIPSNCRFVTPTVQNQNKRTNRFTPEGVAFIRSLLQNGSTVREVADLYGATWSAIDHIKHNRSWKGVY